jgi:hypothetical protein
MISFLTKALVVLAFLSGTAYAEEPNIAGLAVTGGVMSVAGYFGHIATHELAHCAVAQYYGAEITQFSILPTKEEGEWHLGYMTYEYEIGSMSDEDHAFVSAAPTLLNLGTLATFTLFYETGLWPSNKYVQLGLTIAAMGAAFDAGAEVFDTRRSSDMSHAYELLGYSKAQKLVARIAQGLLVARAVVSIARSLWDIFISPSRSEPSVLGEPILVAGPATLGVGWRVRF